MRHMHSSANTLFKSCCREVYVWLVPLLWCGPHTHVPVLIPVIVVWPCASALATCWCPWWMLLHVWDEALNDVHVCYEVAAPLPNIAVYNCEGNFFQGYCWHIFMTHHSLSAILRTVRAHTIIWKRHYCMPMQGSRFQLRDLYVKNSNLGSMSNLCNEYVVLHIKWPWYLLTRLA